MELAKKIKKISAIVCISCLSVAALIGLGLLFSLLTYVKSLGSVLFTLLTFFVASLLLLNSVEGIRRKNKFAYISLGLIGLSSLLTITDIWIACFNENAATSIFTKILYVVCAISILFNVISSKLLVLGKKLLVVQILTYLGIAILEVKIVTSLLKIEFLKDSLIIVAIGIITFVLFIVISIKGKFISKEDDDKYITITKEEYESLKARIAELEKQNGGE